MLQIEARASERWPHWFKGINARIARPLLRGFSAFTRLDAIEQFLEQHPHLSGLEFVEGLMRFLDVRYRVDDLERQRIPLSGACVIYANHPLGGLDALALLKMVGDLRRDVRIVANDWLRVVEPLAPLLLPVRVFGGRTPQSDLNAIDAALAQGDAVIIFPAGAVSRLGWRGIADRAWRASFLRFAATANAPLVPVHIKARNSFGFYAGAAVASSIGTALLPRQTFVKRRRRVDLFVDRPLPAAAIDFQLDTGSADTSRALARRLQAACARFPHDLKLGLERAEAVAHPAFASALTAQIAGLECLGETADGKLILLAPPGSPSLLLRELARLRELTFRAVGEGAGKALDWDRFDAWYDQLILWDAAAQRIVGGYRLARCAQIQSVHGRAGLYTASLFQFEPDFDSIISQGLELGRSFVVPDYWGSRSLDYLWYGIGAYLRRYPQLRYLFGTVSISAAMPAEGRDRLVAYYQRYFGDDTRLARAAAPYRGSAVSEADADLDAQAAFRVLRDNLTRLGTRVPTLFKQYTELCAPGGARFLAFGIDRDFSNAVDGLILVDLDSILPRKRQRYLAGTRAPTLEGADRRSDPSTQGL